MTARPEGLREAVIIYDAGALTGDDAARDVVVQMDAIDQALRESGVGTFRLPVDLDLRNFQQRLRALRPGLVFNLVESLDGSDRLQTMIPLLLEEWDIPFTGCGSIAMHLSNHKLAGKRILADRGLPVPACAWLGSDGGLCFLPEAAEGEAGTEAWIIKALEAHASVHLDDASVMDGPGAAALQERLSAARREHGQSFFAERFIDGREFNLSLLEGTDGKPVVLPAAEISFAGLPNGKPRLVGYAAKWDEESGEYQGTPRTFELPEADAGLVRRLNELAAAVWEGFGISGYARVDFRVDMTGEAFILEANSNPCLAPDSGFAAAAERAGISYRELVGRIAAAALTYNGGR